MDDLGGDDPSCIALAASEGHDALPMMAAIALPTFLGGIAGLAVSAICSAFLFQLSDDSVGATEIMIAGAVNILLLASGLSLTA
jgi:hypothetical protein